MRASLRTGDSRTSLARLPLVPTALAEGPKSKPTIDPGPVARGRQQRIATAQRRGVGQRVHLSLAVAIARLACDRDQALALQLVQRGIDLAVALAPEVTDARADLLSVS